MIVVVGNPIYRASLTGVAAVGLAARVALAARAAGAAVQLVGKAGEDAAGDEILLALAGGGVGHVALRREAARQTPRLTEAVDDDSLDGGAAPPTLEPLDPAARPTLEPADLDLALRYLTDFAVLVLAEPGRELLRVAVAAASWHDATLIVLLRPGDDISIDVSESAIVLEAPGWEAEDAFAELVGSMAARVDHGEEPSSALRELAATAGWTAAEA